MFSQLLITAKENLKIISKLIKKNFFQLFNLFLIEMPLSELDIKRHLKCELCSMPYELNEEPKIMPCFKTICQKCVLLIEDSCSESGQFKCLDLACGGKHLYSQNGFPVNKIVSQLITELRNKRSNENKEFETNLNSIEQLLSDLSFDVNNSDLKIKKHCDQLRSKVKQSAEEKIKRIKDYQLELISRIDIYERECIQNFSQNKDLKPKLNDIISKIDEFLKMKKKEFWGQIDLNEKQIGVTNDTANSYRLKLEEQKLNLESLMFNYKLMDFEANRILVDELSIGNLTHKPLSVFLFYLTIIFKSLVIIFSYIICKDCY